MTIAAFTAFVTFYSFAGAPTLRLIPWVQQLFSILVVATATLFLVRRLPRTLMPPARRPVAHHTWLRRALAALVPDVLLVPRFDGRGIVSRVALRRIWDEHSRGRHDYAPHLWSLLMLELWFRQCVDGEAAGEPLEYAVLKAVA